MFPCTGFGYGFWWIMPVIMIAMIALCFFMMRGHGGGMMCRPGSGQGSHGDKAGARSALDILDGRYAKGDIDKQEYEQKKSDITKLT